MASLGHLAVGIAAARSYEHGRPPPWSSMAAWSALSLLPDVDVIGFALGVPYADTWGHRGATHSLTFSVALGVLVGLAARRARNDPFARAAVFATVVLASHAFLDTMTDGGLGCALLWPFDQTRYFAPWRPIPVAPIGLDFFSHGGLVIASTELVLFSPLLLFALLRPEVQPKHTFVGCFAILWLISCWLIASPDRARQAVVGFALREDTAFASGFSESAFRQVATGQSDEHVRRLLGAPLAESWLYPAADAAFESAATRPASSPPGGCAAVNFENGSVVAALELSACRERGIEAGMSHAEVERSLGVPPERCWRYTRSPRSTRYRLRVVCFANAKVAAVLSRWE